MFVVFVMSYRIYRRARSTGNFRLVCGQAVAKRAKLTPAPNDRNRYQRPESILQQSSVAVAVHYQSRRLYDDVGTSVSLRI